MNLWFVIGRIIDINQEKSDVSKKENIFSWNLVQISPYLVIAQKSLLVELREKWEDKKQMDRCKLNETQIKCSKFLFFIFIIYWFKYKLQFSLFSSVIFGLIKTIIFLDI